MRFLLSCLLILNSAASFTQEVSEPDALALEAMAEITESDIENNDLQLDLQHLVSHPISINRIEGSLLADIFRLTPLQVASFLNYREVFGSIRSKYELQAIPYWSPDLIRQIAKFFRFSDEDAGDGNILNLLKRGNHQLLMRTSGLAERLKGTTPDSMGVKVYPGSPQRVFFRYTYQYKQLLWYGFTGDKDAGETLITKGSSLPDFTSFHFFVRRKGLIKTIAVGDYTINIGQGLVQWQGLAFGKTSDAMAIYRQGNTLQPYRSGGEFNFHRGGALQFQKKRYELSVFGSLRKLSGSLLVDSGNIIGFSSINESGYHRTPGERTGRKQITQMSYGSHMQYLGTRFRGGISMIRYNFSMPLIPRDAPYNLFNMRGINWWNAGIHYSLSIRNLFLFGEAATCKTGLAMIQGVVISLNSKADMAIVYRNLQPGYQSLYARTFSENSNVSNEVGTYMGLTLLPHPSWKVQAYIDFYRFPWLRFRVDAPTNGSEWLLQFTYTKRRKWEGMLRLRSSLKPENESGEVINQIVPNVNKNARIHFEKIFNPQWVFAARLDQVWFEKSSNKNLGSAFYLDARYQPKRSSHVISARLHYFNTDGYDARIYAYERDLLYSFSIPAFYDKGWRYYLQLQGKLRRDMIIKGLKVQWWLRWAQTVYNNRETVGSGYDEIIGNRRSEWKCQLMLSR